MTVRGLTLKTSGLDWLDLAGYAAIAGLGFGLSWLSAERPTSMPLWGPWDFYPVCDKGDYTHLFTEFLCTLTGGFCRLCVNPVLDGCY